MQALRSELSYGLLLHTCTYVHTDYIVTANIPAERVGGCQVHGARCMLVEEDLN